MQRTGVQCFMVTNKVLMVNMFITETARCGCRSGAKHSVCVCAGDADCMRSAMPRCETGKKLTR